MASFFSSYWRANELLLFFLYIFNLNKVKRRSKKVPPFKIWKSVSPFSGWWTLNLSKGKRHLSEGYNYFIFCVHSTKFARSLVDSDVGLSSLSWRKKIQGLPVQKEIIAIYVLDSAPEKFVGLKRSLDSRNFPMWANRLQITDVGLKWILTSIPFLCNFGGIRFSTQNDECLNWAFSDP